MEILNGYPLILPLTFFMLSAALFGLRAFFGYRGIARDAERDYEYKLAENMVDKRLSRAGYTRAYKRFYAPRNHLYIAGTLIAILLLSWPAFISINLLYKLMWVLNERPKIYAPGRLPSQFVLFFSLIGFWILITYVAARQYYRHKPVNFRNEQIREYNKE